MDIGYERVRYGDDTRMVTYARVNHGRWIVDCLNCNSAELLVRGATEFICSNCHQAHSIIAPMEMNEINIALKVRPRVENRNWTPSETVEMLHLENVLHGVEDM